MAAVQCSKCTAERKGFRRELDSWRHRLIHCVGFETILEGIYGPMLMKDLSLFVDCEPEEVDDWSPETSRSQCSFCKLLLEKLSDQETAPTSPLSPPTDYSSWQGPTISDSSHSAQRFLHAVFHKKDVTPDCDSNIPLVAQELMTKMIHQFAVEYASKCTNVNYISRTSSPSSEASDAPLDLTVSRPQEEKEDQPEIDGALDLSKRNCATVSSSSNSSGSRRPSVTEESGDVCLRGTKVCQRTALEAVLLSLCPSHQSLLHQILKAAHQAKCLSFSHAENPSCLCGTSPLDKVSSRSIPLSGCKARNCRPHCPSSECDHQSHCSAVCGPEDSKSCWNVHHPPVRDCGSEGHWGSSCICVWRCRTVSCESLCSKRSPCVCCQSLSVTSINNVVSSPASPPLLPQSTRSTPPSRFCSSFHKHCSCLSFSCHWSNLCQTQAKYSVESAIGDGDHHCPVLNREHSPSPPPPPLSPIPSDINKKNDEKPPSLLHHRQVGEAGVIRNSACLKAADPGKECEPQPKNPVSRQAEYSTSGTSLQDVVSRFSEKLETIAPAEKDPEMEQQQFPSTSQSLPFHGDSHLTEIITRVLHSGSASDYSLSELFNRHDSGEPKSPNTRLRRRQEVLAAISRPADDASTRRQKLKIKRYFAMFDQSCNRRKESLAKKRLQVQNTCANSNLVKEISKTESMVGGKPLENHSEICVSPKTDKEVKEDLQEVVVTEKLQIVKDEVKDLEIFGEKKDLGLIHAPIPELQKAAEEHSATATSCQCEVPSSKDSKAPCDARKGASEDASADQQAQGEEPDKEEPGSPTNHLNGMRRSTRNIVPPQRFSSYVTEPRKMLFVACFSDGIFNSTTQNKALTPDALQTFSKNQNTNTTQNNSEKEASQSPEAAEILESTQREEPEPSCVESKDRGQMLPQTLPIKEKNDKKQSNRSPEKSAISTDSANCGKLRTSPRRLASMMSKKLVDVDGGIKPTSDSPSTPKLEYRSPIKLMFVSPVKDKEGVKYSLKSTGGGSNSQTDHFDPCEESSWSGTLQKHKRQMAKCSPSPLKSRSSPLKSSSPAKPVPSSPSTPPKTVSSPRSASSSPKSGLRRSGQSTPTKHLSESNPIPSDLVSAHETTPPKRGPGRPKKLGPQLEQKVKRPIGRPRKQKDLDAAVDTKSSNPKAAAASDTIDNVTKNLKVTVVYGRSRRNKRMVSEGLDQLQTDFSDSLHAEDLNNFLTQRSKNYSVGNNKNAEEINFATPEKKLAPLRKPGRPAKVKITGISVTVTTVSPRRRQIQLNKDVRPTAKTQQCKKVLLPESKSTKEPRQTSYNSPSETSQKEEGLQTLDSHKGDVSDESVALRHSNRVRKPSIHFLHAVATSPFRSYSRSNALLRRSKQLLLTKASNERRQEEKQSSVEMCGEKPPLPGQKRRATQDLSRVAGVSVDSIFSPKKPLKWWASSAEEKAVNQELARRIQVITDTWVSDHGENKQRASVSEPKQETKGHSSSPRRSKQFSVVRTLFDCPLNLPRSCSMQQIHSWFMQTTETQSLAIVKKTSSRNPFELMHFPRCANKTSICPSPQAERLSRHTKKFATAVPQSPLQHQRAQQRLRKARACKVMGQLLAIRTEGGKGNCRVWCPKSSSAKLQADLFRAKMRFLTKKEKEQWLKRNDKKRNRTVERSCPRRSGLQPDYKRLHRSVRDEAYGCFRIGSATCCVEQTLEPLGQCKEQKLCSKAWSPETLKECRVFLRKINSPNESAEEGWNSCTVTLDDGSPASYLFAGKEKELRGVVKAVKSQRKRNMMKKTASREPSSPLPTSVQMKDSGPVGRQKGKPKSPDASDLAQPPPAKTLRQSRVRGMTGLKWRDFVFGN